MNLNNSPPKSKLCVKQAVGSWDSKDLKDLIYITVVGSGIWFGYLIMVGIASEND